MAAMAETAMDISWFDVVKTIKMWEDVVFLMWLKPFHERSGNYSNVVKTTNWPGENGKHTTYKNGDLIMNGF